MALVGVKSNLTLVVAAAHVAPCRRPGGCLARSLAARRKHGARRLVVTTTAGQAGELVAASKTPRSAQPSWRGYNDRAGELQLTLTYSATWISAITSLSHSRVLRALKWVALAQASLSVALVAVLQSGGVSWPALELPHQLVSVALGLLLVHRMTQAQARFWDGRRSWQRLLDLCRANSRRAVLWVWAGAHDAAASGDEARAMGRDIAAHMLAFVAATEARLRCKSDLTFGQSLSSLVPHSTLQRLEASPNAPLACADELGVLIDAAQERGFLTPDRAMALDSGVHDMLMLMGECDCIARTPTPVEFSTHTSRFLTVICFTLPLVLAPTMGWWTVPASLIVSYALLAIDEISAVVESPFNGYLPLNQHFAALLKDVLNEFLGEQRGSPKSSRL